jgi:hypothetical protein
VADLPEPKLEWHRYRRYIYRCRSCQRTCQGRGDLELPGSHIGPRARLLTCYSRAHLGISLGKTRDLLHDFFGLTISRTGLLGHFRWGGQLFAPVVDELQELLRQSPVVQGDETGWRINGQPAWAWCFRDPHLALFLIDRHRSCDFLIRVLGESFAGTLVSDFYAAYNGLDCAKQRCLVHLLRELAKLRKELPWQSVRAFIQPLIDLFRDAIQLGKDRERLDRAAFDTAYRRLIDRFDELMLETHSRHPDCVRIWKRLYMHCDELFTFLDDPAVPADNNGTERDIRSLTAAERRRHAPSRLECGGVRPAQERDRHRHEEPGPVHPVWDRSGPCPAPRRASAPSLGCDPGYQLTTGRHQPAPARAPCPP